MTQGKWVELRELVEVLLDEELTMSQILYIAERLGFGKENEDI